MTTLQQLRSRIGELIPDVMKLEFGCEVSIEKNEGYGGSAIINEHRTLTAIQCKEEGKPDYFIGARSTDRGYVQPDFRRIAGKKDIEVYRLTKILGRDPTLADVLRAIGDDYSVSSLGYFEKWIKHFPDKPDVFKLESYPNRRWDLSKPLSGQSQKVWEFIWELIK